MSAETTPTGAASAAAQATRTETYTHSYDDRFVNAIGQRTAARDLAFLLPHLRPGMRVLDCGCGPGSITADVAAQVAPGEVVGVDREASQVEIARRRAAERGLTNARFETGSVYDLPFPDASFDAAYAHTVVQHVREPLRALREIRRVLKPGGLVGIRDDDWGSCLWEPRDALVEQALSIWLKVWQHDGGDPYYARHQRRLLGEAGFARPEGAATARSYGSLEMTRRLARIFVTLFEQPAFVRTVVAQGWADEAALAAMRAALRAWGERADAYYAIVFPEAIGWVDQAETAKLAR
jgi:SAM-dependent methyltransferase